ncbi:MAG: hypothetical protein RXR31_06920 [Thermoproteota archaeon]|jgi:hypothetical protein
MKSEEENKVSFPPYVKRFLTISLSLSIVVIAGFLVAYFLNNLMVLDYVHVITGGTWTGIDLFMGTIMSRIMLSLDVNSRVEVAKRLTPLLMIFMPTLSAVVITAGYYLANRLGWFIITSPWIIAAGVIVIILTVQGFGILMRNEIRVFLELNKQKPNVEKIVRLTNINLKTAGSQAIFQLAIIFVMAHLAIFGPF